MPGDYISKLDMSICLGCSESYECQSSSLSIILFPEYSYILLDMVKNKYTYKYDLPPFL